MGPRYRPAEARDEPFIWVTWLTKLISGDAQCEWSLWFRARHSFDKLEAGSTLDGWTKDHNLPQPFSLYAFCIGEHSA